MARDATKIFRDTGNLSIGGSNVGFTGEASGGIELTINSALIPIRANELGVTVLKMVEGGIDVTARVLLAQWDSTTYETFLGPWHSAGTITIDAATVAPGEFAAEVAFSFVGVHNTYTAGKCIARVASDPIAIRLMDENVIPLNVQFVPDTGDSDTILTITAT